MRFLTLLTQDVAARLPGMLLTLGLVLLGAYAVGRVAPDAVTGGAAFAALMAVPLLHWLLSGLTALWSDFANGTFLLWRSLGVPGGTVVAARYVRTLLEVLMLLGALVWAALSFGALSTLLREVRLSSADLARLALVVAPFVLTPPAIALAAGVMGRASRLRGLAGLLAFVALWTVAVLWTWLAGGAGPQVTVAFARLPSELCTRPGGCALQVSVLAVLAQPLLTLLTLWVAARALESTEP